MATRGTCRGYPRLGLYMARPMVTRGHCHGAMVCNAKIKRSASVLFGCMHRLLVYSCNCNCVVSSVSHRVCASSYHTYFASASGIYKLSYHGTLWAPHHLPGTRYHIVPGARCSSTLYLVPGAVPGTFTRVYSSCRYRLYIRHQTRCQDFSQDLGLWQAWPSKPSSNSAASKKTYLRSDEPRLCS